MLQSIRDHTQGWIAGIIISLLILSFALWGIHSYLGAGAGSSTTVAKVNGVEITKGQLAVGYERLHRQVQMQYGSHAMPENAEVQLKNRVLQTLIEGQVLKQASLAQDYRVSSDQIDNYLESIPGFQVNGQFSPVRFQELLATTLYTANDFLDLIETSLLIDQPRLGFILTSFALPNEVTNTMDLVNQERNVDYVIVPFETFLKQNIIISADKVLAYYQQHQDEFKTPEQVSIDYITFSVKDLMSQAHPNDTVLKNFYNQNSNSYAQPMQWKLENIFIPVAANATDKEVADAQGKMNTIFQKVKNNPNLSWAAHSFSNAKDTKLQGWITLNQVPVELQKSLLSLDKPKQISNPVRMSTGFIILKVIDFKEAEVQPFAKVKDKVKEAWMRQQAEEKFGDLREKLANITYEHPDSLQFAATELGLPIRTSGLFSKDKGGQDITANNKVREAAFSNDVLALQNNSDVIQISSDTALVLRVKSHVPATLLSLKTVEPQILERLKASEAEYRAKHVVEEIKQKLQSGHAPSLTWSSLGFIGRHSNKVDLAILETAFEMPKPTEDKKVFYDTVKVPNGYAVVALKGVREGAAGHSREGYGPFAEQIQSAQGLMEYELYKQSLVNQAKIVVER